MQVLLDYCETTELKLAILFAAVGTMRRGEACAVTFDDVNYQARTVEAIGGWKPGSNVLKRIYQDVLVDEMSKFEEEFTEKNHFAV